MHARVSTRQIQSGQMDEAVRILRDQMVPAVRQMSSFKEGLVLTDRSSGKLVTISLWETEADSRGWTPPGAIDVVVSGSVTVEIYEVADQVSV